MLSIFYFYSLCIWFSIIRASTIGDARKTKTIVLLFKPYFYACIGPITSSKTIEDTNIYIKHNDANLKRLISQEVIG